MEAEFYTHSVFFNQCRKAAPLSSALGSSCGFGGDWLLTAGMQSGTDKARHVRFGSKADMCQRTKPMSAKCQ